jgi:hypothetical protein
MREVFQQELLEVRERLVEIAGLVAVSIENATRAFTNPASIMPPPSSTNWPSTFSRANNPSPAICASS